jgi:hypothetical protein
MTRLCHDCGATPLEASFTGSRKPRGQPDRCTDCAADPLTDAKQRIEAHRRQIAGLQALKRLHGQTYRTQKPHWTAPLFRMLRPSANA